MILTEDQKELFKALFFNTVEEFSNTIEMPLEQVFLQVIPLAIQTGSDYLISYERQIQEKLSESRIKSNKIKQALDAAKGEVKQTQEKSEEKERITMSDIIGRKVVRGPDWKWNDQDGGAGSVGIVEQVKSCGWVKVKWIENRNENKYRFGYEGKFDLVLIEEEKKKMKTTPTTQDSSIPEYSEQIKKGIEWLLGKTVVRGRDWKWSDQDGGEGNTGIVTDVGDDGWAEVKWTNGKVAQYRWGPNNCYDLRVVPSPEQKKEDPKPIITPVEVKEEKKETPEPVEVKKETEEKKEEEEIHEQQIPFIPGMPGFEFFSGIPGMSGMPFIPDDDEILDEMPFVMPGMMPPKRRGPIIEEITDEDEPKEEKESSSSSSSE